MELGWCMLAAESSDVWRSWLAIVSWLACGSVAVTQLEYCGDIGAGAVGAWASLVVRLHGSLIRPVDWEGSSVTVLAEITV